jgi:hypothetical protein
MLEELDYNKVEALNQSLLKKLANGPRAITAPEREETDSLRLGSLVDDMICDADSIHDKYVVCTISLPSDTIIKIVEMVLLSSESSNLEELDQQILEACSFYNYQAKWKDDTKIKKIKEEGKDYFDFRKNTGNKMVVSADMWLLAEEMKEALLNDRYSKYIFEEDPQLEAHYQFVATGEIEGQLCKGKLDRIVINHEEKIIDIYDIKTTSDSISAFKSSYLKYRYDIQGEFYKKLVEQMYPGYTVCNMIFVVCSYAYKPLEVRQFRMTNRDHWNAYVGYSLNHKQYKGIKPLIEDYIWYKENQEFDYSREHVEANGQIEIGLVVDQLT